MSVKTLWAKLSKAIRAAVDEPGSQAPIRFQDGADEPSLEGQPYRHYHGRGWSRYRASTQEIIVGLDWLRKVGLDKTHVQWQQAIADEEVQAEAEKQAKAKAEAEAFTAEYRFFEPIHGALEKFKTETPTGMVADWLREQGCHEQADWLLEFETNPVRWFTAQDNRVKQANAYLLRLLNARRTYRDQPRLLQEQVEKKAQQEARDLADSIHKQYLLDLETEEALYQWCMAEQSQVLRQRQESLASWVRTYWESKSEYRRRYHGKLVFDPTDSLPATDGTTTWTLYPPWSVSRMYNPDPVEQVDRQKVLAEYERRKFPLTTPNN